MSCITFHANNTCCLTHTQTTHVCMSSSFKYETEPVGQSSYPDGWVLRAQHLLHEIWPQPIWYSTQKNKQTTQSPTLFSHIHKVLYIHWQYIKDHLPAHCGYSTRGEVDDFSPPLDFFLPSTPPFTVPKWYIYIGHNLNHHACRLCWMCRQTFLQSVDADRGIMRAIDRIPCPRHPSNQTTPLQ